MNNPAVGILMGSQSDLKKMRKAVDVSENIDDDLFLIDELLTPDSSRFWPKDQYNPGKSQPSFDKQFLRDYLDSLDWGKPPPPPPLPAEVIDQTAQKYEQALKRLTVDDAAKEVK